MRYFLFLSLLFSLTISSHPHMFIDTDITVVTDKNGIKGVNIEWIFDDMFSSVIIKDYDKNGDKKFSKKEKTLLKQKAFEYTADQNYFLTLKLGKKALPIKPKNFTPTVNKKGLLVYNFFVPCSIPIKKSKQLKITVFDSTLYISFEFSEKNPVKFKGEKNFKTSIKKHNPSGKDLFVTNKPTLEFIVNISPKLKQL